jgi:translation initiation factor 5A
MSDEIEHVIMKEIRSGRFLLIDGEPCRAVEIDVSAPGKHGSAKMRITGIGVFDGKKRTLLKPADAYVDVPIITKRRAQVVSVTGENAQLMDSETYEVFELPVPEELRGSVTAGISVELIETMGKKTITRTINE